MFCVCNLQRQRTPPFPGGNFRCGARIYFQTGLIISEIQLRWPGGPHSETTVSRSRAFVGPYSFSNSQLKKAKDKSACKDCIAGKVPTTES
eukprot:4541543-Prymnesium_polylepis.1